MTLPLNQREMERLIWLQAQAENLTATWQAVQDYRAYYAGDHPVFLSRRQQEYLGDLLTKAGHTVCFNVCRLIVDVLRERLRVISFESDDPTVRAWLADLWNRARLDLEQITLYRRALRDGASYLVVGWDSTQAKPILVANRRYDGNSGITLHYDAETQSPQMAVKYWTVSDPLSKKLGQRRRTIYLPDRILRQQEDVRGEFGWSPIDADEGPALQWWTDNLQSNGKPLGLAVIEFANPGRMSEIEDIIGLQNAINKTLLDLLAAADLTGFQMYAVSYPGPVGGASSDNETATSDDIKIGPGYLLELFDGATLSAIRAGDLRQLIDTLQTLIGIVGRASRTPQYYLWQSGNWGDDVPSGEALKQMESGLVARAHERTLHFGDAWVTAMRVAMRFYNAMGVGKPLNAEANISPVWASTEVRNELLLSQEAQNHAQLGVPLEILWRLKLGYTADQIAEIKRLRAQEQAQELANHLIGLRNARSGGDGHGSVSTPNGTGVVTEDFIRSAMAGGTYAGPDRGTGPAAY